MQTWVAANPWDLVHDRFAEALDFLQGEVGVSGLTIRAASGPLVQWQRRSDETRVFRTRGGLYFPPNPERYTDTRCKPVVSDWVKKRDPLARLAEACAARGLRLRAVVSATRAGRMALRHPAMAVKNALAAVSESALCIHNPDVQAFLFAILADLAGRSGLAGVVFAECSSRWAEAEAACLAAPFELTPADRALLSLCFCESCAQQAGAEVDPAAVRRSVQTYLQRRAAGTLTETQLIRAVSEDALLQRYVAWQTGANTALLRRLDDSTSLDLRVLLDSAPTAAGRAFQPLVRSASQRPVGPPFQPVAWPNPMTVRPSNALPTSGAPTPLPAAIVPIAAWTELPAQSLGSPPLPEVELATSLLRSSPAPDVVAGLQQLAALGVAAVSVADFASLPPSTWTALKQAIRFARRATST